MRFFDHQLDARVRTRRLRLAFLLAVVGTVAGMHLALAVPFVLVRWLAGVPAEVIYPRGFLWVNIATPLMLILGGWWIESSNTRHGVRLAERLGARLAQPGSRLAEQRLANIVQEMSIAAHMPLPTVLVLPREMSINAFASGMEPADWAVTVTEGALEYLKRDELMGLVAHELSHLREGDTALNMRLIGMVFGLEMVWGFGQSLCTAEDEHGHDRVPVSAIIGVIIMAVGWCGWLAGRVLQAAVSREREYLADARAVQWTRQADGLGCTLRKCLGQQQTGVQLRLPQHHAFSHLLLAEGEGEEDGGRGRQWLATHPPLAERIRRIYGGTRGALDAVPLEDGGDTPRPDVSDNPFRSSRPLPPPTY